MHVRTGTYTKFDPTENLCTTPPNGSGRRQGSPEPNWQRLCGATASCCGGTIDAQKKNAHHGSKKRKELIEVDGKVLLCRM